MTTQEIDTQTIEVLPQSSQVLETVTKAQVEETLLTPNHAVLSTGVRVSFHPINPNYLTDITVAVSEGLNLKPDGSIREDDLTTAEQLAMAGRVQKYHNNMIRFGVRLESNLPKDDDWLDEVYFLYSDLIEELRLKPEKKIKDKEFLYLRFIAFQKPEDWQVLSDKTMEVSNA